MPCIVDDERRRPRTEIRPPLRGRPAKGDHDHWPGRVWTLAVGARCWQGQAVRADYPELIVALAPVPYPRALAWMTARADAVGRGEARECIWLLEHPSVYTAGTSADPRELLAARFPVVAAGRGGRYTYHGPRQRVGYVILDLTRRGRDVRCFVAALEQWVIDALATLGVEAFRAPGRIGIWTVDAGRQAKIGAIGVRVRRWVTMHGFSLNIDPDLSHFDGIVPCGLPDHPVTSLARLGSPAGTSAVDHALRATMPGFLARPGVQQSA